MTKMQITAKAMLTTLGIYAAVTFISSHNNIPYRENRLWLISLYAMMIVIIVYFVGRSLIFKNDFLISKILDPEEDAEEFDRRMYLIKAFRIAFVLLALLLLCSSRTIYDTVKLLQMFSLPNIRMWIIDAIETGQFNFSKYTFHYIVNFLRLSAIIYLLFGAPHIIRWHLRHSCLDQNTEGVQNE